MYDHQKGTKKDEPVQKPCSQVTLFRDSEISEVALRNLLYVIWLCHVNSMLADIIPSQRQGCFNTGSACHPAEGNQQYPRLFGRQHSLAVEQLGAKIPWGTSPVHTHTNERAYLTTDTSELFYTTVGSQFSFVQKAPSARPSLRSFRSPHLDRRTRCSSSRARISMTRGRSCSSQSLGSPNFGSASLWPR